ncbi:MAG: hypothetical protein WDN28_17280 [Chthoniobacter sp.]
MRSSTPWAASRVAPAAAWPAVSLPSVSRTMRRAFPAGENGAGEIQRAADVRGLAFRGVGPLDRRLQVRGGRLPELGLGGETDDARGIVGVLRREARRDEVPRFLLRRRRDAGRVIDDEQHRQFPRRQQPADAGQRQDQQQHDERAQGEAHLALGGRHVGQRAALRPDEEDKDQGKRERPGMRQIHEALHSVRLRERATIPRRRATGPPPPDTATAAIRRAAPGTRSAA